MALTQVQGGMLAGSTNTTTTIQSNGTTAITIDSSQNVGVGSASSGNKFEVAGSGMFSGAVTTNTTGTHISYQSGNSQIGAWGPDTSTNGTLVFFSARSNGVNGLERMRIASDGTLQVKSSTTTAPWDATSGNYAWIGGTYPFGGANSDIIAIFNRHTNNGTVVEIKKGTSLLGTISHNGTNTAYNTSSDYRLKENIAPMQNALNLVQQLKPCTYTWKANGSNGQGFIAHELQECLPDAVTGEKDAVDADGKIIPQQIDTSFLVATLTAAIQELKAELDATKAEVAALKAAP